MLRKKRTKVANTNENYSNCLCYTTRCPTYNRNKLNGGLFCSRGKSERIPEKEGCICFSCPIWVEYNLKGVFFCTYGALE